MKLIHRISILLFGVIICNISNAQNEANKTEILILGTQHLNQIVDFNPVMLNKLITKLDSLEFDAVCIENMPAQLLYDIQSRNDSAFVDVLENFGGDRLALAKHAQELFKINLTDAQNEIDMILQKDSLSGIDRNSLIQYFIASTDIASAVLQYKYLQGNTEFDTLGFSNLINQKLDKYSQSSNEIYSLAVPLALNRNIQKLEYIDNFQDEAMLLKYFPQFISDYIDNQDQFKDIVNHPVFLKTEKFVQKGIEANDLLELYVFINSKEYQEQDFEAQWKIWLKTNFPSGSDRARYALWEMRNLQITANIMNTVAFYPEKKIIVIIGASHKSFLEKFLREIPYIKLIELK